MSDQRMPDVVDAKSGRPADAEQALRDEFIDGLKQKMSGEKAAQEAQEAKEGKPSDLQKDQSQPAEVEAKIAKCGGDWFGGRPFVRIGEPTAEEIKQAKEKIEKQVSGLISDADRKTLMGMANAILDGNLSDLQSILKGFAGKPELLEKFVDELERIFKATGAGVHATVSSEGKLILYKNHGGHCLEVSADGTSRVRPITVKFDGTVVLEQGEVLGKKAKDVIKDIGNEAVDNINHPIKFEFPRYPQWPIKPYDPHPEIQPYFPRKPIYQWKEFELDAAKKFGIQNKFEGKLAGNKASGN